MLITKAMGMCLMNGYSVFKERPFITLLRCPGREAIKNPLTFERKKVRGWQPGK
jgi:hypothetical protein